MIDTQLLDEKIKESGYKTNFLISKLGLSANGFYKKKSGQTKFRVTEVYVLRDLLRLTPEEEQKIFYS